MKVMFGRGVFAAAFGHSLSVSVSDMPVEADVVLVGAGYAGLSAARDLQAAGLQVVVLEANDRVGGRTLNEHFSLEGHGEGYAELGGQWLDTRKNQPYAWSLIVDELGFEVFETPGGSSWGHGDDLLTSSEGHPYLGAQGIIQIGWVWEEMSRQKLLLPLDRHLFDRLDQMTLEDWFQEKGVSGDAKEFFRTIAALGASALEPSEISALEAVITFGGTGLFSDFGAQGYRVKGGLASPALAMAEALEAVLFLNMPVVAISQDDVGVLVTAQSTLHGTAVEVHAKRVLFSGPPVTTLNITFTPPLPREKQELLAQLKNGNCMKATLVYSQPFWREQNVSGTILNLMDLDNSPFSCMDNTPPDTDLGVLLCLAEGKFVDSFALMSEEDRQNLMAEFVARYFGEDALEPLHYADHDWNGEPFIQGSYSGPWRPGVRTHSDSLMEDFNRVSWIGADVIQDAGPRGYVNGAIMTGRETAKRLVTELVDVRLEENMI